MNVYARWFVAAPPIAALLLSACSRHDAPSHADAGASARPAVSAPADHPAATAQPSAAPPAATPGDNAPAGPAVTPPANAPAAGPAGTVTPLPTAPPDTTSPAPASPAATTPAANPAPSDPPPMQGPAPGPGVPVSPAPPAPAVPRTDVPVVPPPATVAAMVCGDGRDSLLDAYKTQGIRTDLQCGDFTRTRGTPRLGFASLVRLPADGWALLRDPLLAASTAGFGLDLLIENYGTAREINSSYRDPIHNQQVGGAKRSRHLFGDAADVRNVTRSQDEWDRMWTAAEKAKADYIEPLTGPCKLNCLHADWRNHDGGYGRP